ncbi:MAG: cytidylate kinase [Chloroflexi bacterium]|nr:cytidylate kinase [Chloroflexota bacterium]
MIITIDGAAGTGKTTVGKFIANKINYKFLDSGKIYRAYTFKMIQKEIFNNEDIIKELNNTEIKYSYINEQEVLELDGQNVSKHLHNNLVDEHVSNISKIPEIRTMMTDIQRKIVSNNFIVVGRDIGTVVLPDADLKIFLKASIEERARRRFNERKNESLEEIENSIRNRDHIDSTRKTAPLKIPDEAKIIDTENKNIDEVSYQIIKLVK